MSTGTDQYYMMMDKESITRSWYLTQSPLPVSAALISYLGVVLWLGPRLMAPRKPLKLRGVMRVYNILQVLYNSYVLVQFYIMPGVMVYLWKHSCRLDNPDNILHLRHKFLLYSWHYFVLKLLDLFDTLFMVLRKKDSHITFLHVYHHVAMVFFTWVSNKYIKAQQGAIPAVINMAIHTLMYSYYFLATFGPSVQKYLWWKSHLTKMQLGQFFLVIMYLWWLYCNDCDVSQPFNVIWIINVFVISAFFVNFYVQTYIKKRRASLIPKKTLKD